MKIKERLTNKDAWIRYRDSLRYALHCIVRPFDGFWDLTHEKRASQYNCYSGPFDKPD